MIKRYIIIKLISFCFLCTSTLVAEEPLSREEVDHKFGTKPNTYFLPKTPFNTEEVPSISMDKNAKPTDVLPVYRISPNTYFFYGNIAEVDEYNRGSNANAGFVVTSDGVVVIDSLGSPLLGQRMISTIKGVTDKPIKYLIITHNHPDHAYGAIAFRNLDGVKVIGHEGTLKYINSDRIEHSVNYRNTFIANDMKGFKPVTPDIMISGDLNSKTRFVVGDRTFDIYNTGSHHSYGDLVVHQVEEDFVWISDLAFNNRTTFMADGHSKHAIDEHNWLLEKFKNARLMIPGHGSAQTKDFPMVTKTRDYMQALRDRMTKAVDDEVDLQTAVDNNELEEWKNVPLYELNHKKNIDFVYREMEEELF